MVAHRSGELDGTDTVWYVAYGSNMLAGRLRYYLAGGRPVGGLRSYPGCRDPRPPVRTAPVEVPGGVFFALESRAWTGGMAFLDPDLPGRAVARGHLITRAQFADLAAQEMYLEPGTELDLAEVAARGRVAVGEGRYQTLVYLGELDGRPMVTFTCPWRLGEVPLNAPSPRYLGLLGAGLREAHGWDCDRAVAYLVERPGVAGAWTPERIAAVLAGGLEI